MRRSSFFLMAVMAVLTISTDRGRRCEAQVHHVVGGDRGWETATDVGEWSVGRVFRVGDKIWFTFSGALDNVIELGSREELESCDLSNPIRLYTDGLLQLDLDREGVRYFTSGGHESCNKGLKLDVNVQPRGEIKETNSSALHKVSPHEDPVVVAAAGPTPSTSVPPLKATHFIFLILVALALLAIFV